jgi:hypothetical protein
MNLFGVISEELTPSHSLSKRGKKGLDDSFIPRVYTRGYNYFIPPGFYDAQIFNLSYEINNQNNSTTNLCGVSSEELTPSHSLSREGKKGCVILFTPGCTRGYKHSIPPGFYMTA